MNRTSLVTAIAFCFFASLAAAQPVGVHGYVTYGSTSLTATESFKAVADSNRDAAIGFGGAVTGVWKDLFVDVGVPPLSFGGERVFVDAGRVYRLGIPLAIKMRSIDVAAGWRFVTRKVSPYIGGGLSLVSLEESSPFAIPGDDVSESASGPLLLGGLDFNVARWLRVGGELRYRAVSGGVGQGGVSHAFNEDQVGGLSLGLRVSVGH